MMNKKNVILARPNLFIVNEMQRLVTDCGYTSAKIEQIDEIEKFDSETVGGVVISTGIHSSVDIEYAEVVEKVMTVFPNSPILLASMIDFDKMKRALMLKFEQQGIDCDLLSIEEANEKTAIDKTREFVVLQKNDITDAQRYPLTKTTISKFFV